MIALNHMSKHWWQFWFWVAFKKFFSTCLSCIMSTCIGGIGIYTCTILGLFYFSFSSSSLGPPTLRSPPICKRFTSSFPVSFILLLKLFILQISDLRETMQHLMFCIWLYFAKHCTLFYGKWVSSAEVWWSIWIWFIFNYATEVHYISVCFLLQIYPYNRMFIK